MAENCKKYPNLLEDLYPPPPPPLNKCPKMAQNDDLTPENVFFGPN